MGNMQDKTVKMRAFNGGAKAEPAPIDLERTQDLSLELARKNVQEKEEKEKAIEAQKMAERQRETLAKEQAKSEELEAKVTSMAAKLAVAEAKSVELHAKLTVAEAKVTVAEAKSAEFEKKINAAETRIAAAEAKSAELDAKASAAEAKAKELLDVLNKISSLTAEATRAKQGKTPPKVDINLDHI